MLLLRENSERIDFKVNGYTFIGRELYWIVFLPTEKGLL